MENKIIIVESDQKHAEKGSVLFQREGLLVNTTDRAADAIRKLQQEHFSVLILDVGVKDMGWDEAVQIIKDLAPALPIIITSDQNTPELEAKVLRQKVFYYHVKSFGTDELTLAVRNACARAAQGR